MNLKIYIATHLDNIQVDNELYSVINVKEKYPILNRIFSEYCAMHYVYHNKIYSDFIGFCHYSRKILEFQIDCKKDSIQYFYLCDENGFEKNFKIDNNELSFLKYFCYKIKCPTCYIDICQYLKTQKHIPYNKIKEHFNNKHYKLYGREIYITDYKLFEKLVNFIDDYIYFIKKKYNIKTEEDWKQHIIDTYILRHRALFFETARNNDYNGYVLWQSKRDYYNIFNDDYGFSSSKCNSWRIYSYMIEILISLFIYANNHHSFILKNDNEEQSFSMLQNQYDYIWQLLKENKSTNICELGSGYSTLLFDKYLKEYNYNGKLISIEHQDSDKFNLIENTSIKIGDTTYENINKYENLEEYLVELNLKFDFVLIDGPYSWQDYLEYGRIQMLDFIEYDLLSDKGIFMIHDSQRNSVKKTIELLLDKMSNKDYKYNISYLNKEKNKELTIINFER